MSVYATVAIHIDDDWLVSVAVFPVEEPVRINHGDDEWFLNTEDAQRLRAALERLDLTGLEETRRLK